VRVPFSKFVMFMKDERTWSEWSVFSEHANVLETLDLIKSVGPSDDGFAGQAIDLQKIDAFVTQTSSFDPASPLEGASILELFKHWHERNYGVQNGY
jgi:hypothetical protein